MSVALSLFQDIGIKAVAKILGLASEFYLCPICKTTASWEPTIHTGLVETFKVSAAKFPQDGSLHPGSRGENTDYLQGPPPLPTASGHQMLG